MYSFISAAMQRPQLAESPPVGTVIGMGATDEHGEHSGVRAKGIILRRTNRGPSPSRGPHPLQGRGSTDAAAPVSGAESASTGCRPAQALRRRVGTETAYISSGGRRWAASESIGQSRETGAVAPTAETRCSAWRTRVHGQATTRVAHFGNAPLRCRLSMTPRGPADERASQRCLDQVEQSDADGEAA